MTSSPLQLKSLQKMANDGFDTGVLALMEHRAVTQAVVSRELKGHTTHPREDVLGLAESLMPQGERLIQAYAQTMAGIGKHQVDDLAQVASNLSSCVRALESAAVRTLASMGGKTVAAVARAEQVIGERYAQLMEAADTLARGGVITVRQQGRLSALSARPDGPLAAYYDKACAIVEQRQREGASAPRMRAV